MISFCAFNVYKKVNAAWKGEKASIEGVDFQYKIITNKDEITSVLIGIERPSGFNFTLKQVGAIDKFFIFQSIKI